MLMDYCWWSPGTEGSGACLLWWPPCAWPYPVEEFEPGEMFWRCLCCWASFTLDGCWWLLLFWGWAGGLIALLIC